MSEFSRRGTLQSSMFVHACAAVCCNELTVRAQIVWNAIRRSYGSMVGRLNDQTDADRFVAALETLKDSLTDNAEIQGEQRGQAVELADDLLSSVKAVKPNPTRIGALFGALGQTVNTIASLRPAWETVRDAALAIGLLLA